MSIISNEHRSGSPPLDLDELDREGHEWDHGQLLRAARSLGAELRTLRARVAELEDKAAGYLHAFKDGCVRSEERITELECQRDLAQDEARALNEKRAELRATIRDLESRLAAAREVASPNEPR